MKTKIDGMRTAKVTFPSFRMEIFNPKPYATLNIHYMTTNIQKYSRFESVRADYSFPIGSLFNNLHCTELSGCWAGGGGAARAAAGRPQLGPSTDSIKLWLPRTAELRTAPPL